MFSFGKKITTLTLSKALKRVTSPSIRMALFMLLLTIISSVRGAGNRQGQLTTNFDEQKFNKGVLERTSPGKTIWKWIAMTLVAVAILVAGFMIPWNNVKMFGEPGGSSLILQLSLLFSGFLLLAMSVGQIGMKCAFKSKPEEYKQWSARLRCGCSVVLTIFAFALFCVALAGNNFGKNMAVCPILVLGTIGVGIMWKSRCFGPGQKQNVLQRLCTAVNNRRTCEPCGGTGQITETVNMEDDEPRVTKSTCKECGGSGKNGRTGKNFLITSWSFWLNIFVFGAILLMMFLHFGKAKSVFGDHGSSLIARLAIIIPGTMFMLGSIFVGCARYKKYKAFLAKEGNTHSKWSALTTAEKGSRSAMAIRSFLFFVMLLGIVAFGVAAGSGKLFTGDGGMAVVTVFCLMVFSIVGLMRTSTGTNPDTNKTKAIEFLKRLGPTYSNANIEKGTELARDGLEGAGTSSQAETWLRRRRLVTLESLVPEPLNGKVKKTPQK